MSDLVKRLRSWVAVYPADPKESQVVTSIVEAADTIEALQAENARLREANELAAKIAGVWVRRAMHLSPDGYAIERAHGHMASACEKEILALTDPAAQEGKDGMATD